MKGDDSRLTLQGERSTGKERLWDYQFQADSGRRYDLTVWNDLMFGEPTGYFHAQVHDPESGWRQYQVQQAGTEQTRDESLKWAIDAISERERNLEKDPGMRT